MGGFRASRLWLGQKDRSIELQLHNGCFHLRLIEGRKAVGSCSLTAEQLRRVSVDMRQVECDRVRLWYQERLIVVALDGAVWARVPDTDFMRLHSLAVAGQGEEIGGPGSAGRKD